MRCRLILLVLLLSSTLLFGQEETVKTGWNFGALPTVSFDADLGFQYGGLVNLYEYGDGSRYPAYNHSLYLEISRFTKGSAYNRFFYDSDRLINGLQTTADISYLTDKAYDFFGFNGYEAVYNSQWTEDDQIDYKTRMFYKYGRKLFRFKLDVQGQISSQQLRWLAGMNLLNFKVSKVNIDKLNKGKDEEDRLPSHEEEPGLYEKYMEWGLISADESNGGFVPSFKAGLVFDSRDNQPNPMKGIWTEAVLLGSPEFLGGESSFSRFSVIHRQYFTLIPKDLSLVYRLTYQTMLGGTVPFYYKSQVITSRLTGANSEGLGGAKSLRGVKRNRVVGDGIIYGNLEARWKVTRFRWINNNFYIGLNGFLDLGRVTKKVDLDLEQVPLDDETFAQYFNPGAEKVHMTYGAGLRVVMNQNFIVAVDYGIATDSQDGDSGLYIGLNYLF